MRNDDHLELAGRTGYSLAETEGEALEDLGEVVGSGWWAEILRAAARPLPDTALPWAEGEEGEELDVRLRFLHLLEPLIRSGLERLRWGVAVLVREKGELPWDSERAERRLLGGLGENLGQRLSPSFARELPETVVTLRRPEIVRTLLRRHPELAREVVEAIELWVQVSVEALARRALGYPETERRGQARDQ